jgi:hypothetical protein
MIVTHTARGYWPISPANDRRVYLHHDANGCSFASRSEWTNKASSKGTLLLDLMYAAGSNEPIAFKAGDSFFALSQRMGCIRIDDEVKYDFVTVDIGESVSMSFELKG